MGWILLEAFVALLLALGIVWWTTRARRKPPAPSARAPDGGNGQ